MTEFAIPATLNPTIATPSEGVQRTMPRFKNATYRFGVRRLAATLLCVISFLKPSLAQEVTYLGADEPTTAEEIYGQGVRETPWLSPQDEQQSFHLPP